MNPAKHSKLVLKCIVKYHPDNHMEREWEEFLLFEEITKILSRFQNQFKEA